MAAFFITIYFPQHKGKKVKRLRGKKVKRLKGKKVKRLRGEKVKD